MVKNTTQKLQGTKAGKFTGHGTNSWRSLSNFAALVLDDYATALS